MVVYPDAHILDVVGPLEVLTGAKLFLPNDQTPYEVHVVAHKAGLIRTTSGLTLEADQSFEDALNDAIYIQDGNVWTSAGVTTLESEIFNNEKSVAMLSPLVTFSM